MAWLGAAVKVGSAIFGAQQQKKAAEVQKELGKEHRPGFTDSGWTGAKGGATFQDPIVEAEAPRSKWDRVNQGLGSNIGKIGTDIAGGFISDYRGRRNRRNRFKDLKSEGLTAQEIAGGGGAGGSVTGQGNTLGSGPATQVSQQLEFQKDQARLERANKLKIAKVSAGPAHRGVDVQEERLILEQLVNRKQLAQFDANLQQINATVRRQKFDLENFWPTKFAAMGPDNGMFALAAFHSGIDLERVLRAQGEMSPAEARQVQELYNDFLKIKSSVGRETLGIVELWNQLVFGKESLTAPDITQSLGRQRRNMRETVEIWKKKNPKRTTRGGASGRW